MRAQEWASLELDGGLSELERALLHAHLDRCPTCSAYAASVQAITTQLRAAVVEEPVLAVRPAAARAQRVRVRLLVAAAVVVVAAGLGSLAGALSRSQAAAHPPAADLLAVKLPASMAAPIPVRIGG